MPWRRQSDEIPTSYKSIDVEVQMDLVEIVHTLRQCVEA
jgi:hypothetical protein